MSISKKSIVILGAGPIGLEAALHGADLGHEVNVFERGRIADNVRRWSHVRLFSPWKLNRSRLGLRELRRAGVQLNAEADYPTGGEFVERYLLPLARLPLLSGRVHEGCTVVQVGRDRIGKLDLVGGPRECHPFRVLLETARGERSVRADAVLDCTGTYGNHNWLGNGNIPAIGERGLRHRIAYLLEDLEGSARERYVGRRVLLVGAGLSAATALDGLLKLDGTSVVWIVRDDRDDPLPLIPDDPLPERNRLSRLANDLARGGSSRVECRRATNVEQLAERGDGFRVALNRNDSRETVDVDRILAHVGYAPDNSIYRELQVHECYASFGPMKLAATLLAEASADCLAQPSPGAETLRNPEPGFFILGAKSYGKHSTFLIRTGLQQVQGVYSLLDTTLRSHESPTRSAG